MMCYSSGERKRLFPADGMNISFFLIDGWKRLKSTFVALKEGISMNDVRGSLNILKIITNTARLIKTLVNENKIPSGMSSWKHHRSEVSFEVKAHSNVLYIQSKVNRYVE